MSATFMELTATPAQRPALLPVVLEIFNRRYEIGYCLDHRTQNYIVTWRITPRRRQQIVVLPRHFLRITGADPRSVCGCIMLDEMTLDQLGFVVGWDDTPGGGDAA